MESFKQKLIDLRQHEYLQQLHQAVKQFYKSPIGTFNELNTKQKAPCFLHFITMGDFFYLLSCFLACVDKKRSKGKLFLGGFGVGGRHIYYIVFFVHLFVHERDCKRFELNRYIHKMALID